MLLLITWTTVNKPSCPSGYPVGRVPHPSRTLRRVGYENPTPPSILRLGFSGEGFVVSHPFAEKPAKGWGTQSFDGRLRAGSLAGRRVPHFKGFRSVLERKVALGRDGDYQ